MSGAGPVADTVMISGGVAASQKAIRKAGEQIGVVEEEHDPLKEILSRIERHVASILDAVGQPAKGNIDHLESFQDPIHVYFINNKGRKYTAIFTPVAVTINANVRGLGVYAPNLAAGWSFVVFPNGTEITVPSATGTNPVNLLFMETDDTIGVAI